MNTYWRALLWGSLLLGSALGCWAGYPAGTTIAFTTDRPTYTTFNLHVDAVQTAITWSATVSGHQTQPGYLSLLRKIGDAAWDMTPLATLATNAGGIGSL